jgi:hypothetical protein
MNMVQRITRHLENEAQLNECNAALQQALDVFTVSWSWLPKVGQNIHKTAKVRQRLSVATAVAEMKISSAERHKELMELFGTGKEKVSFDVCAEISQDA